MSAPKILVTGADGFIGSHLTEMLFTRGYQIKALTQYNSFNNWGHIEDIGCKDKIDNIAYSEIEFEVVVPPKIIIFYDDTPPLTEGTFKITVIPNKKLREVPTLYYTFTDDDEFKRDINLVKEGDDYYGYIIIDAQKLPRSGIFTFQGFDLQGNQGNEITAGAAFLVDTIKPNAPQDLVIKALGEGISLNWYYSGEKPEKFNVYRSTTTGVSYIHLYDQTIKQVYTDTDVSSNQLYYYRIATVDIAGNVGPLSKEVSIYGKSNNNVVETNEPEVNSNPPTQDTRKWKEQMDKDIETLLIV